MSATPPVCCVASDCRKVVEEARALFFDGMPYCSRRCFGRFHVSEPDARGACAPQDVPLQEGPST